MERELPVCEMPARSRLHISPKYSQRKNEFLFADNLSCPL